MDILNQELFTVSPYLFSSRGMYEYHEFETEMLKTVYETCIRLLTKRYCTAVYSTFGNNLIHMQTHSVDANCLFN